jgi:hypothetical protein
MELTLKQVIRNINTIQNSLEKHERELKELFEKTTLIKKKIDSESVKYKDSIQSLIELLSNESK